MMALVLAQPGEKVVIIKKNAKIHKKEFGTLISSKSVIIYENKDGRIVSTQRKNIGEVKPYEKKNNSNSTVV